MLPPFQCNRRRHQIQPVQSARAGDVEELQRLAAKWNDAHLHADANALDMLCADDLEILVPKTGMMTKLEVLGAVRTGGIKFSRYTTSDVQFRLHGDTALAYGRVQRTRVVNGQEVSDDWRFTKTYVKEGQQWRVVAFHASES